MTRMAVANEQATHMQICGYLRAQYPRVIFNSDGAGNNLSKAQRGMNTELRSRRGYPDIFIAEPNHTWHGMFIEVKREGVKIWRADGQMVPDAHIREQYAVCGELTDKGYYAVIASGFDEAKLHIDAYMNNRV